MKSDGTISSTVKLANGTGGGPALVNGDNFGTSLAATGDLNHDGVPDLAIGAQGIISGLGAVFIALMNADGTISSTVRLAHSTNGGPEAANGTGFGSAVAGLVGFTPDSG